MSDETPEKPTNNNAEKTESDKINPAESAGKALKALQEVLGPTEEIRKRMNFLSDTLGENSAASQVAKQIAEHQKSLDSFKEKILGYPDVHAVNSARRLNDVAAQIKLIENPIHETNKKLANIEGRFGDMYEIATEAAQIANSLNAAAAEFLVKFEHAALSNEKSARKAILSGIVAIMIAVLMPVFQVAYNELWAGPKEAAEARAIISDLKSEIAGLQQQQNQTLQGLKDVLQKSDNSTLDVLQDIKGILLKPVPQENVLNIEKK